MSTKPRPAMKRWQPGDRRSDLPTKGPAPGTHQRIDRTVRDNLDKAQWRARDAARILAEVVDQLPTWCQCKHLTPEQLAEFGRQFGREVVQELARATVLVRDMVRAIEVINGVLGRGDQLEDGSLERIQ